MTFPAPTGQFAEQGQQSLVLGGGCFWCTEAIYLACDGVSEVTPGYAGGDAASANYQQVCSGQSGHAEVIRIDYDADQVKLGTLLMLFFSVAHDPTQHNRQGNDIGSQYRSVIFYSSDRQRQFACDYITELNQAAVFAAPIVTTLEALDTFYPAEDYHHNYAARNPQQPYVRFAALPKLEKFVARYPQLRKAP